MTQQEHQAVETQKREEALDKLAEGFIKGLWRVQGSYGQSPLS